MPKIIGIVPAKCNSTRLERKNFQKINGKTLLTHAIDYLCESEMIDHIDVYTDDLCDPAIELHYNHYFKTKYDIRFKVDPEHAGYLTDLYYEIYKRYYAKEKIDCFVCTTPDNPVKPENLNSIIEYFLSRGLHEYVTFGDDKYKNGSLHIISKEALENNRISGYMSYARVNGIDIHTIRDLQKAREICNSSKPE